MQLPIIKLPDKSLALEVPDDLLQQLTSQSSSQAKAQLAENEGNLVLLKESQEKVIELEEQLQAGTRTMDDFSPTEKAEFVIAWGKALSPERKAVFAQAVGIPIAGAEVVKVAEEEGNPKIITGKTDKPGYIYYDYLNISMRE